MQVEVVSQTAIVTPELASGMFICIYAEEAATSQVGAFPKLSRPKVPKNASKK